MQGIAIALQAELALSRYLNRAQFFLEPACQLYVFYRFRKLGIAHGGDY